jgi:hypothetical protein
MGIDSFRSENVNVVLIAAISARNPGPFQSANASAPRDITGIIYHRITQEAPKMRALLSFVMTASIMPSLSKLASSILLFPST